MSTSAPTGRRFKVRVTLMDGTVVKCGGYQNQGSADAEAERWVSEDVFESRLRNGAVPVLAAVVLDPSGQIINGFGTLTGEVPQWKA